ncbi:MAG: sterol desaturase family protein [Alphaproteobacteria bacterium]|nr:sterol desaturase family protein [Alphaproteobacteria bacterium]
MEDWIRLGAFLAIFAAMALWEGLAPRRPLGQAKGKRWTANLGILLVDILAVRFTLGAAAYVMAVHAQGAGWGLLNVLDWPNWIEIAVAVVFLDFAIYLQHIVSHALPVFWRLHQVHHSDLDFDTTTGIRFHPVEILVSLVYKVALVAASGADPWAVLLFEVILNGTSLFNHGNVRIFPPLERVLRFFIVTPEMHRVHHSTDTSETNTNFGFALSVWDRLCGTYRQSPAKGHLAMEIGLIPYRDVRKLDLGNLLAIPFRKQVAENRLGNWRRDPPQSS